MQHGQQTICLINNNFETISVLFFRCFFPYFTNYFLVKDVELEQPIFGANYIKGKVRAQPGGQFVGEAKFKLHFKSGGAIDFGQAMLKAAQMASRNVGVNDAPPPYTPPTSAWYAAPPPAYSANPAGYQGWVPPTHVFPDSPPANSVFMTDAPPPYPGITGFNGYNGGAGGWQPAPPSNQMSSADRKAAEAAQVSSLIDGMTKLLIDWFKLRLIDLNLS